jgi:hypothetical protein
LSIPLPCGESRYFGSCQWGEMTPDTYLMGQA